jgi:hypothetical protein
MLKNLKKLNRADLREIKGGGGPGKCDIGPMDVLVKFRREILV